MKYLKEISLCLIAVMLFNDVRSQQPYHLTDDSNRWYEYGQFGGWGFYPVQHVHLSYFFNGDTLINGLTYKQLFHDRKDTIYSNPIYLQNSFGYTAAFRQDSLKVYFIMRDSVSEKLYCDFDLAVGDTLKYLYNSQKNIIDSVTSIPFGLTTRTCYNLNNGFSFYEGVGNALGLFHDYSIGIEGGVYLVCFEQAGITQNVYDLWGTPPACGLSLSTAIEENLPITMNSTSFPNPFSNELTFSLSDNEQTTVTLYNFLGQQILQQTFANSTTINTEQMQNGIYFYELRNDKGTLKTGKVVKQ
ncbi:MAG: T9SS type A sorting domain-containing protein [Chitinophagales bacterium]